MMTTVRLTLVGVALASALAMPAFAQSRAVEQDQRFLTKDETARVRAYHDRIVEAVKRIRSGASLADLVAPVLQLADARSVEGDATAENRAAILAIAVYVNGRNLAMLIPEARTWPRAERRALRLHERGDLAQHFSMSAAIAAAAGAPIANAIGLYKELDDARRGSGFSFADLAADRAGIAFGLRGTLSIESARLLQSRVADGLPESQMMPAITGLPENLPAAEFTRRYRGANAPAYTSLVEEIDRRIAALGLFQDADPTARLAEAEARWNAQKPAAYQLTVAVSCFCVALAPSPPSFQVMTTSTN